MILAFNLYDLTGSGFIDKDEALKILQIQGYPVGKEDNQFLSVLAFRDKPFSEQMIAPR